MQEGYVIYVITAKPRFGRRDTPLRPLDNLDGKKVSLVAAASRTLTPLVGQKIPEVRKSSSSAHRFTFQQPGRSAHMLLIECQAGPFGARGAIVETSSGDEKPFVESEATMLDFRAAIFAPPGQTHGLLFVERRAGRAIKNEIEHSVTKPVGLNTGTTIKLTTHVDPAAWESFLDAADIATVKAVYRPRRVEDFAPGTTDLGHLTLSADGGLASRIGTGILRERLRRLKGQTPDAIHIDPILRPGDRAAFGEPERVVIGAEDHGVRRTVELETDGLPQWVYLTQRRLGRKAVTDLWTSQAEDLMAPYRASAG